MGKSALDLKLTEKLRILAGMPWLCMFGCHSWEGGPGSECWACGRPDTLFDSPQLAKARIDGWAMERLPAYADRMYAEAESVPLTDEDIARYTKVAMDATTADLKDTQEGE